MLDGSAVLYEAADPLVRYSPVINCLQLKMITTLHRNQTVEHAVVIILEGSVPIFTGSAWLLQQMLHHWLRLFKMMTVFCHLLQRGQLPVATTIAASFLVAVSLVYKHLQVGMGTVNPARLN